MQRTASCNSRWPAQCIDCKALSLTCVCVQAAERLLSEAPEQDGNTHNAMVLAAGLTWRLFEAEHHLHRCVTAGFAVQSSSFCALIAAYW